MSMTEHTKIISYSNEIVDELKKLQHAGCWVISSSFRIEVKAKPNWFHRQMARLLLGWKWEDRK